MSRFSEEPRHIEHRKGEKRGSEGAELDKVNSANNWEEANLGDDGRRSKFLRLMGANKKQHSGRFIIGDKSSKHGRSDDETVRLTRQLEHQYQSGLDLKLSGAARQHSGLGFQRDDNRPALWSQLPNQSKPDSTDTEQKASEQKASDSTDSKSEAPSTSDAENTTDPKSNDTDQNGKGDNPKETKSLAMKLNFVKASS